MENIFLTGKFETQIQIGPKDDFLSMIKILLGYTEKGATTTNNFLA